MKGEKDHLGPDCDPMRLFGVGRPVLAASSDQSTGVKVAHLPGHHSALPYHPFGTSRSYRRGHLFCQHPLEPGARQSEKKDQESPHHNGGDSGYHHLSNPSALACLDPALATGSRSLFGGTHLVAVAGLFRNGHLVSAHVQTDRGFSPTGLPVSSTVDQLKELVAAEVHQRREVLVELSHRIHAHPELCFQEHMAASLVADTLQSAGLKVERGAFGLPTALRAQAGSGELTVALCAEYDALPEMGHACGHNIIAAAAAGAGIALARVADEAELSIEVIGTPAEEGGGGKVLLLERGAFDGVHFALMVHPGPVEQEQLVCLAASHFTVRYHGKAAHASGHPHEGINAADAITLAQVAIGLLRQQLPQTVRVHGIVKLGGQAANAIPELTEVEYFVRAPTLVELDSIEPKVLRCFEAGALATGCTMEVIALGPRYSEFRADADLVALYRRNAEALGRHFPDSDPTPMSTDMANVSLVVPSIHPMIGLETMGAVNHQPAFAEASVGESADRAVIDGAIALAWTAIDAATTPKVRERLLGRS
jgi:amidohydrolase